MGTELPPPSGDEPRLAQDLFVASRRAWAPANRAGPERWLAELLALFDDREHWRESPAAALHWDAAVASDMKLIPARELPEPHRTLLVHEHHMTVALEAHYGRPVQLEKLAVRQVGDDYARKLLLRAGTDGPVVMAGIMRFLLQHCAEGVRQEILEARKPLGRILIEHDVMREIRAAAFLKVGLQNDLGELFGVIETSAAGAEETKSHTFGRLAVMLCNGEPAIELLEIVAPQSGDRR